jgi:hypothetical protein
MTPSESSRSYVVYGTTAWDGPRQAEHNLAHALSAHHPVLYVDPAISPATPIRYGVRQETWRACKAVADRRLRRRGNVTVFAPLVLPPIHHPRARALSLPFVRWQVRRAVEHAKLERPVVLAWRLLPELSGVAGECLRVAVVMDHPSAGAELMGRDPAELEAQTAALCEASDLVCTTSHPTQELLASRGCQSELVPFGFPGDQVGAFDAAREPAEYSKLPRPLLGYTGGIDDRLDFELIVRLADRFSEGSLVFVGPLSPRLSTEAHAALASRPNIHLLGPRPRADLPGYVRYLDVALMPYEDSVWTRHQSPMKLWEYLYAGPPIVATASPDLRWHPSDLLSYAETIPEALEMTARALADPGEGRDARRAYALANTWDDRARQIERLVAERLNEDRLAIEPAAA